MYYFVIFLHLPFCCIFAMSVVLVFCVVFLVLFVFVLWLVYPMLPVSLDCELLIAASDFSNVYLDTMLYIFHINF